MNRQTKGFTLVEVLVAIAVMGVIFLIIAGVNDSMAKGSRKLASSNQVAQESQNVQRLLAGRIAEAIYVYPAGVKIPMGSSGVMTKNTIGGRSDWTVNKDPLVAMIMPPREKGSPYRYVVYYAIKRKELSESALSPSSKPSLDPLNPEAWVLMQFSANLGDWKPTYSTPSQGIPQADLPRKIGAQGNSSVLADYVQPQKPGELFAGVNGGNTCLIFCVAKPTKVNVNDGVVDVRFRMEQKYDARSQAVVIPAKQKPEYLGARVSPRNWFIPTAP